VSATEDHRIAGGARLAPGELRQVEIDGRLLCLARTDDGELFAIDDTCTHEEESLAGGWLDGSCIECPAHNAIFDLRSGEATMLPATEPVGTYLLRTEGDDVVVTLPDEA